jgi:hypothetical protein
MNGVTGSFINASRIGGPVIGSKSFPTEFVEACRAISIVGFWSAPAGFWMFVV